MNLRWITVAIGDSQPESEIIEEAVFNSQESVITDFGSGSFEDQINAQDGGKEADTKHQPGNLPETRKSDSLKKNIAVSTKQRMR